jgi:hypothetical protein
VQGFVNHFFAIATQSSAMDTELITDPKLWQSLTDQAESPLPQRWLYGAAAERIGRRVTRLAAMTDERTVALAQVVCRHILGLEISLTTRGPMFLDEQKAAASLKVLKTELNPVSIKVITPDAKHRRIALSATPVICEIDLKQDIDTLRAAQHAKWRNALRKVEKTRLKVAQMTATPDALMPLLRAEKTRQSKGLYRGLPPEFTLALQDVAPKSLYLYGAADAQMLFIRHGNSATYHMGHSGPEGRAANAHNLILWHAIQKLKTLGVTRLDLGTIDTKNAPDLARFKQRSGAQTRTLAPAQLM